MHKKGILKTNPIKKVKAHIKFDEESIMEYDKLRGQKMKIDEPKTPYEYSDEEKKIKNQEKIKQKLKEFNVEKKDEVLDKHQKFLEKRRLHYQNEFHPDN